MRARKVGRNPFGTRDFIPERPPLDASDEAFGAYRQASKEFHRRPRHTYSAEELDAGYVKYQELYRGQQDFKRAGYGNKELVEAMARLPNLHDFVMTMANCIEIASRYLGNSFTAGLRGPFGDTRNGHVDGVPQLQSIYRSAFLSGTKFKSFVCGDVGWQLFKSTKKDLAVLASVISESHRFSLQLFTGHDEQTDMLGSELRQCRRYLKNGRIRDLIIQAEKLESLRFILDWSDPVFGVDLKTVVGDHAWTRLSHVSFGNMEGLRGILLLSWKDMRCPCEGSILKPSLSRLDSGLRLYHKFDHPSRTHPTYSLRGIS